MSLEYIGNISQYLYRLDEDGKLELLFDKLSLFSSKEDCLNSSRPFATKRKAWAFFKAAVDAGEIMLHNFGSMTREEAQRQEEAGHNVSRAVDQTAGVRQSLIAWVGQCGDGGRYDVGCPCLTVLKPAFFQPGDCFIWRQADTPELAGKWDVVKGLRDGVEKAWLEKDESYVQGGVAAEMQKYEDFNSNRREKKRKAS